MIAPVRHSLIASVLISAALAATLLLPKAQYESPDVLAGLNVPHEFPDWKSVDVSGELQLEKDDRYNFVSEIFARVYGTADGRSLLFLILDAGNFHHPKVCFGSSGFVVEEREEEILRVGGRTIRARPIIAAKGAARYLILYWMVIDGKQADWLEQKWGQFWASLFLRQRTGLMMRLDVPLINGLSDEEALAYTRKFLQSLQTSLTPDQTGFVFGN